MLLVQNSATLQSLCLYVLIGISATLACDQFFPGRSWPIPLDGHNSDNLVKLCQTQKWPLDNPFIQQWKGPYYATLFDTSLKIPVYSANRVVLLGGSPNPRPNIKWTRLALGLCLPHRGIVQNSMVDYSSPSKYGQCMPYQAVDADYVNTGYDRGHIEPSRINQNPEHMTATFTLTNAAPQIPNFNRGRWRNVESGVEKIIVANANGKAVYVVTGTLGIQQSLNNRVAVPAMFWKAVCFPGYVFGVSAWSFGVCVLNADNQPPIKLYHLSNFAACFPNYLRFNFDIVELFGSVCAGRNTPLPPTYPGDIFEESYDLGSNRCPAWGMH